MDAGARAISAAERGDGMSLLIEGIGAPITCADCDYSIYVGLGNMYCKLACKKEKTDIASKRRADFCPMKEIEEPHGRLGDLDALYKEISNGNKAYNGIEGYDGEYPNISNVDDCLDAIKYAETVIEAERSEE